MLVKIPKRMKKKKKKKDKGPLNILNIDLIMEEKPTDVIDSNWFIFKDYFFHTRENLMRMLKSDFRDLNELIILPAIREEVEANWFQLLDNIRDRLPLFLDVYKSYLIKYDYPNANFEKFHTFLKEVGVLRQGPDDDDEHDGLDSIWLKEQIQQLRHHELF